MNRITYLLACLSFCLLSSCVSVPQMQKELAEAPQTTLSFNEMAYNPLTANQEQSVALNAKSPTYLFKNGKGYYAAFAVAQPAQPKYLKIKTYLSTSYLPAANTFVPQIILLDENKQSLGIITDYRLDIDSDFWLGPFFTANVQIPTKAAYLVIHAAETHPEPLIINSENGNEWNIPLAPAGKVSFTLGDALPIDYDFAMVTVKDSAITQSSSKADIFYVAKVDNKDIKNSLFNTEVLNRGRGLSMETKLVDRELPANKLSVLTIVGRTHYAAPIQALTNKAYQVKGQINFVPKKNRSYIVKGELGEASSVWLEDEETHEIMDKKIEVKGSSELGFLEK